MLCNWLISFVDFQKMALFSRLAPHFRRSFSQIASSTPSLAVASQKYFVHGVDDVLFGLTDDQIQVFVSYSSSVVC